MIVGDYRNEIYNTILGMNVDVIGLPDLEASEIESI